MSIFTDYIRTSLASENSDSVTGSDKTVSSGSEGVADSVQLNASKPTGVLAPTAKIAEGDGSTQHPLTYFSLINACCRISDYSYCGCS